MLEGITNNYKVGKQISIPYNTMDRSYNVPFQATTGTLERQPQNDKLELNNPNKQGLSKNAKLGIGAVAVIGLGALAYVLTKGKVGSKQVQQLAEHIEFKPATTIEEARIFARTHLGIKQYELTNIDVANHVNEGLVNLSNSVKGTSMFSKVKTLTGDSIGRMSCTSDGKVLGINEHEILESMKIENLQSIFERITKKCNLSHYDLSAKQKDLINRFRTAPSELTFNEKMEFEELISKIELAPDNLLKRYTEALKNDTVFNVMKSKNRIVKPDDFIKLSKEEQAKYVEELFNAGYKQPIYSRGAFVSINHEFGHKLHAENIGRKKFEQICVNIDDNSEQAQKAMQEYFKNFMKREPNVYSILREVSGYAPFSEAEAVAEIYAGLQNGVKYNDKVMALFDKWGGVRPLNTNFTK